MNSIPTEAKAHGPKQKRQRTPETKMPRSKKTPKTTDAVASHPPRVTHDFTGATSSRCLPSPSLEHRSRNHRRLISDCRGSHKTQIHPIPSRLRWNPSRPSSEFRRRVWEGKVVVGIVGGRGRGGRFAFLFSDGWVILFYFNVFDTFYKLSKLKIMNNYVW